MIFLSAQPYDIYFQWQVEVQIVNFRKFGISDKMQVVVWHPEKAEMREVDNKTGKLVRTFFKEPDLSGWKRLENKYPEVKIFYYKDEGVDLGLYIPQLRPHSLKKHFKAFPELENETIFYHDSDIIFNYLPDFESLTYIPLEAYHTDENGSMVTPMNINRKPKTINWQSDCSGYLDYNYLRRKEIEGNIPEEEAISVLAKIGNVSVETIKSYAGKTGGAQCILNFVDSDFWADVERQVLEIRKAFTHKDAPNVAKIPENIKILKDSINTKYFSSEDAGFQSWCADMWALNMALWSRGRETNITPELDFSWATDSFETYQKKPIMHNAGATRMTPHLFYKGFWRDKSPIGQLIKTSKNTASEQYVNAILEVK